MAGPESTTAKRTTTTTSTASQSGGNAPATTSLPADSEAKKKALDDAVTRFKELTTKLGSPEAVKAFFEAYGTEGFAPEKKKEDKKTDGHDAAKELLKGHKIDTSITDRSSSELGLPVRPEGYGAAYMTQDWGIKSISGLDNPSALKPEAWQLINQANRVFHGYVMQKNGSLTRARFPAFQLKPKDGSSGADAIIHVPDFEVFDNSSITIKETTSELQSSMVKNGFSSLAIESSLAAGYSWFSAAASGGVNQESSAGNSTGDFASRKEYTAAYSFPRARVFVDEYNLQVSSECGDQLKAIREAVETIRTNITNGRSSDDGGAVKKARRLTLTFFDQFGHIYPTTFQLGGQLLGTRAAESIAATTDDQKRDSMRISAALSFGTPFVSGSGSVNKESQDQIRNSFSNVNNTSALTWSARGGNTLLVANPPEWANSLASFQTWRTLEQDQIVPILDLIAKLIGANKTRPWSDIPGCFQTVEDEKFHEIQDVPRGAWTGRIKLLPQDNTKKLIDRDGLIRMVNRINTADETDEVVFTVLDADWTKRDTAKPSMSMLYADSPFFLVTNKDYSREDQNLGAQIQGVTVTDDGQWATEKKKVVRIARWSLRPKVTQVDFKQTWVPNQKVIKDNDEVKLYCHSYRGGSYRTASQPPYYAPPLSQTKEGSGDGFQVYAISPRMLGERQVSMTVNGEKKDFPFFSKAGSFGSTLSQDDDKIQAMMQRFDRGTVVGSDETDIENIRKMFGYYDPGNKFINLVKNFSQAFDDPTMKEVSKPGAGLPDPVIFRVKYWTEKS